MNRFHVKAVAVCLLCVCAFPATGQQLQSHAPSWNDGPRLGPPVLRIKCGADCSKTRLVSSPLPVYPQKAKARKLQGLVRLQAVVGQRGNVRELGTLSGNPILAQAAIDAIQHWKYRPTLLNNDPVEVVIVIDIVFYLEGHKGVVHSDPPR